MSQKALNKIRGIDNHERLDEELYHDFEDDDAKKVTFFGSAVHSCYQIYALLGAFFDPAMRVSTCTFKEFIWCRKG